MPNMKATERLYLTGDKQALVKEGDSRGATLYCAPGDEIPESAAERFGLVDGTVSGKSPKPKGKDESGAKEKAPAKIKEAPVPPNKEVAPPADKEAVPGETKAPDLTTIKGIGAKTAKALTDNGIADIAGLAAIDPANPPFSDGLPPSFDWSAVVAAAKSLLPAAE